MGTHLRLRTETPKRMTLQRKFNPPSRRRPRTVAVQPTIRVVAQFLVLVIGLMVVLTGMDGHSNRPSTEVRGEVELIDDPPLVVASSAPAVAIIDAMCITNIPTHEPC